MTEKVTVIVLNWNGKKNTLECIKSIRKQKTGSYQLEIIVVDNASSDDSVPAISKEFPEVKILSNKENLGFSGGVNAGIKYSLDNGADYIVMVNNDTTLDKELVIQLVRSLEGKVGIASPKIYFSPGYEFHKNQYKKNELGKVIWFAGGVMDKKNVIGKHTGVDEVDEGQFDKLKSIDFATGCCMAIKKEIFEKVGYFDERYFLYYEDNDFSFRTKSAGFEIIYQPKALMWHKNAQSTGGSGSSLQDYYITRNRLLFGFKFLNMRQKAALIKESFKLLVS